MRGIKNTIFYSLLLMAVISFPGRVCGQKSVTRADKETLDLILNADDEKGKETGALILLKDYHMTVNENGQTKLIMRVLGKIYSKEAMADYSQIPVGYNSFYLEPTLNYARVIHSDGTVREVPKDAVQVKTTPESQGLQYTDNRFLSFALSGMEPGAAFDYQVTFVQKNAEIEGHWFENHWFAGMLQTLTPPHIPRIDPVVVSSYTLLVPKGTRFQYCLTSGSLEPSKESLPKQDKYVWVFNNLPSLEIENSMPTLSKLDPVLLISSLKDWMQFDEWAAKKLLAKAQITPEISAKVEELTAGSKNDDEKIKVISSYIRSNIRYVYADLDRGGYTPHTVSEILRSRYGDCKDQTVLFIAMLKAAGIEAYPALISPYPNDQFTDIPTPWFTHVITYIPNRGKEIWLDLTSEVTPYPDLTVTDQGRQAFIVNGKGGKLVQTPISGPDDNISRFEMKGSFKGDTAALIMTFEIRGMLGDAYKSVFKELDGKTKNEALKELITTYVDNPEFDRTNISDVNNPELPLKIDIKYNLPGTWTKSDEMFNWGSHTLIPLSLLANVNGQSFPEVRHNDVVNPYPSRVDGTEKYAPPVKDYLPVVIPQNDSVKNEYFEYIQTFSKGSGSIVAKWSFTNLGKDIPAEKYGVYVNAIKSLKEKYIWGINFVNPLSYCQSMMQSENPYKVLSLANQLLQQDPENILALLLKGMVYGKLKQDDQQAKAYQDALKLAPDNKYALLFVTFPEAAKKNPNYILSHLNQALELDPGFEPALLQRSHFYTGRNEFDKAMADIDKVLQLNPLSLMGLNSKGAVLYKMGKELDAYAAFAKTLDIDSSNISLCTMLAQSYLRVDSCEKAINLYTRAIRMDPTNASYFGNLGWAWYLNNNDQKCIEYSRRAIMMDSKANYAKFNIALANLRSGNIADARKLYAELESSGDITKEERDGAKKDLDDLKAKGKYVNEIKAILKDYF